jgi:hypothetical protein
MAVLIYQGEASMQFESNGTKTTLVKFPQPFGGGQSPNVSAALQGFYFNGQGAKVALAISAISGDSFVLHFELALSGAGSGGGVSASWIATGIDGK